MGGHRPQQFCFASASSSHFSSALAWARVSMGCSPVRKICSSVSSPQLAVPSGISICSGVFLSAVCREDLLCHGQPPPPFSDLDVPSLVSHSFCSLFLSLCVFFCSFFFFYSKFSKRCHTLGWWAQLRPALALL